MAITSKPMSIQAGRDYDEWTGKLAVGLKELIAEGAAPAFSGLDNFLALSDRLRSAIRDAAQEAQDRGETTFTVDAPFTDAEQRTLADMGSSILSYLEILTLRGKIDATMSPGVSEAIAAMTP